MNGTEFFSELASRPPFAKAHPAVAAVVKDYLAGEKVVRFGDRFVINTHLPPYPGRAFDSFAKHLISGEAGERRLFSVTLAVTNRCPLNCWHCYNAGRSEADMPLSALRDLAGRLQELGAAVVTLTGGEPLLRSDLEDIARAFDDRTSLVVGTTGTGLDPARARALRESGVFAMGVSLDSADEAEHDRMRGSAGAFRAALAALRTAGESGLYPYVVSVATREFLAPDRFYPFLQFARDAGAREVHLLEPSATGRLAGRRDVLLTAAEARRILDYQAEMATREDMPVVSSFAHLESPEAFGCGAGITHLYVDGAGDVCPCNLVPLSFGNILTEPLDRILDRMRKRFRTPRVGCVGRVLARHVPEGRLPAPPEVSERLCDAHLPERHESPRFFRVRSEATGEVGGAQLREAYDRVHGDYDAFWVTEAGKPVDYLVAQLPLRGDESVFEAGCGTGHGTAALSRRLPRGRVLAADLSEGMLSEARRRLAGATNVKFAVGDALSLLMDGGTYDAVFSSWVLGYIPLAPFFAAAARALRPGGILAFIVHRENSPREPLEIFGRLVAEDPSALTRRVAFDFPRDGAQVAGLLESAGFAVEQMDEGAVKFRCRGAAEVLEHLLRSGAGTAFRDALDPARRDELEGRFVAQLAARHEGEAFIDVTHDYVTCLARRQRRQPT